MTKDEIYIEMTKIGRLKKEAESSKADYNSFTPKITNLKSSLDDVEDNLKVAQRKIENGAFLIDNTPLDQGAIQSIREEISAVITELEDALYKAGAKIDVLNSNISGYETKYNSLENQYSTAEE